MNASLTKKVGIDMGSTWGYDYGILHRPCFDKYNPPCIEILRSFVTYDPSILDSVKDVHIGLYFLKISANTTFDRETNLDTSFFLDPNG